MLNPQARALLDYIEQAKVPPMNTLPVADARAVYRDRRGATQPVPPKIGAVQDYSVGSFTVRGYRPIQAADADVLPALLFLHGGGWVIGDLDTHDTLCRSLSNESGCAVYAVDYRMGPEHRFPAAVQDTTIAMNWLHENATDLHVDATRLAIGGDSAGGNLAAVGALIARDAGPSFQFQLLIYPATDQRAGHDSHQRNGTGYMLTNDLMTWFRNHYLDASDHADWRASPLLASNHADLPPAFVLTAGYDPLVDEGKAYADALQSAGVEVSYQCFDEQIHGFITMGKVIDQANEAVSACANALSAALSRD